MPCLSHRLTQNGPKVRALSAHPRSLHSCPRETRSSCGGSRNSAVSLGLRLPPAKARGPIRVRSGPFESGCGQGIGCDFSRRYHVTVCLVRPANIPSVRPEPVEGRGQTIAPHSKQFPAHLPRAAFDKLRLSGRGVNGWSVTGWNANMASSVCHSARGSHQSGNEGPGVGGRMSVPCHPAG